jgi:hypothetical protein
LAPLLGAPLAAAQSRSPEAQYAAGAEVRDEATRLHVVLLGFTPADGIGPACRKDVEAVRRFFQSSLGSLPGNRLQIHDLTGDAWTPDRILAALQKLPVGPNDNVLVYHSGHGCMRPDGPWASHLLTVNGHRDVPRYRIRDVLKGLRPRGLLLLTDCCSYCGTNGVPEGMVPRSLVVGPNVASVRNLFLKARGLIDITAAQAGGTAQATHVGPNAPGAGSAFTVALLNLLSDPTQTFTAWQDFFPRLRRETQASSNGAHQPEVFHLPKDR